MVSCSWQLSAHSRWSGEGFWLQLMRYEEMLIGWAASTLLVCHRIRWNQCMTVKFSRFSNWDIFAINPYSYIVSTLCLMVSFYVNTIFFVIIIIMEIYLLILLLFHTWKGWKIVWKHTISDISCSGMRHSKADDTIFCYLFFRMQKRKKIDWREDNGYIVCDRDSTSIH